jgi:thymidylate synthase
MGFNLESMIAELEAILHADQKAAKTVKQAQKCLSEWKQYAYDCGKLNGKNARKRDETWGVNT